MSMAGLLTRGPAWWRLALVIAFLAHRRLNRAYRHGVSALRAW